MAFLAAIGWGTAVCRYGQWKQYPVINLGNDQLPIEGVRLLFDLLRCNHD